MTTRLSPQEALAKATAEKVDRNAKQMEANLGGIDKLFTEVSFYIRAST